MPAPSQGNGKPRKRFLATSSSLWVALVAVALLWSVVTWITPDAMQTHHQIISFLEDPSTKAPPIKAPAVSVGGFPGGAPSTEESVIASTKAAYYLRQGMAGTDDRAALHDIFRQASRATQAALQSKLGRTSLPLTAYLEHPLPAYTNDTIPRLASRLGNKPEDLTQMVFHDLFHSCADTPNDFPVMVPTQGDDNNNNNDLLASHTKCPVREDPFLPWIHDAFVSQTAEFVQVIAHNQRRCNTDPKVYWERLQHLEPQVTLMQSVPIKRVTTTVDSESSTATTTTEAWRRTLPPPRQYMLTSVEDADSDAKETRFICQFHAHLVLPDDNGATAATLQKVVAGETLSRYVYNYEHANYQKGHQAAPLLTRPRSSTDDKAALHNENVWNSLLHFQCPIPSHLQSLLLVTNGAAIANLYVDLVPIRTHPRLDRAGYFDRSARHMPADDVTFDPTVEWGPHHVLPPVEASGRWANIPLCRPFASSSTPNDGGGGGGGGATKKEETISDHNQREKTDVSALQEKPATPTPEHFLVGCVWASASFTTRGSSDADTSTSERLLEWLTYQLNLAGFDHVYIYDNSAPFGNTTLEPVTSLFPAAQVTRIAWKHPVCNNNRPANRNPGERSSQYAAEASCRIRYGPTTKWMAVFDTDEYFIPQAPYTSVKHWLQTKYGDDATNPTRILSFFQTRAIPNRQYMDPVASEDGSDPQFQWKQKPDATFLETYNCDKEPFPKPSWSWRAKKQIFQPSYVLHHFVHYSLVTKRLLDVPTEISGFFKDHAPYEKRVDERTEAFMLHTKTTSPKATQGWRKACRGRGNKDGDKKKDNNCPVGIAFPSETKEGSVNQDGLEYNCYTHDRITTELAPQLKTLLKPLREKFHRLSNL